MKVSRGHKCREGFNNRPFILVMLAMFSRKGAKWRGKKNDPLTSFDKAEVALLHGSVTKLANVLCRRRLLSITAAV